MHLWVAACLLVANTEAPAPPAEPPAAPAQQATEPQRVDLGAVGLGLAGGGAALATSTVVFSTLIEALNTPDQEGQPRNERVIQASGLLATGLVSVGAAMMLTGAALIVDDLVLTPRAAPGAPPSE